jgi:hypothetical protein
MDPRLRLFGIRHHGPGSAASLEQALAEIDPAMVLIEGPIEAEDVLAYAAAPGMRPPVALLVHLADEPSVASFYPFAEYSPEWRALLFAQRRGRPVRFIDLPAAATLAGRRPESETSKADDPPDPMEREAKPDADGEPEEEEPAELAALRRDPLSALAAAAGHSDGEAWWNAIVEQRLHGGDIFAAIEEAMSALRAAVEAEAPRQDPGALREARREAHMRLALRQALKDTDGAIAVVTGAWHVPALRRKTPAAEDRALLKGLPRARVTVTWIPWTDTRLAAASGYGAGVISPGWYRHLWQGFQAHGAGGQRGHDLAGSWQARAATLLRAEGLPAATASVIEAARLATSLAALRGYAVPGLAEMQDASLAALCHGEPTPLRLIETRLVIGDRVGEVDDSVPQMPLQADLARWQRRLRLKPEATAQPAALDLRTETGLAKSTLLHRLDLIKVPWGRLVEAAAGRGTFREVWELAWHPELSVQLAEALVWGTTIEQAAGTAAREFAERSQSTSDLATLVRQCLLADLPDAAEHCIGRLQKVAVGEADVRRLMDAVPPLVHVLRYGTARKVPEAALTLLVETLAAEVMAGLPHACRQLDDEAAGAMYASVAAFDNAASLIENAHIDAEWKRCLATLCDGGETVSLIAGFAARRLYERAARTPEETAASLSRAMSPAVPPKQAGAWLEGFASGAAQVLLHDRALLALMDAWLAGPQEEDFIELLPVLRRAFSGFDAMQRRRLLELLAQNPAASTPSAPTMSSSRAAFERALPLLETILGLDEHGG